jgi:glycosyltransferase involved in cell wall biosynthesis
MLPAQYREQVEFLGHATGEELRRLYRTCDIFVAPSLYESFGQIYIEAMSYAKPVIGCGVGGVPEIIKDNDTGILVPPEDAQALSRATVSLLQNKSWANRLGQKAREAVEKRFSIESMVERTLQVYRQACEKYHYSNSSKKPA